MTTKETITPLAIDPLTLLKSKGSIGTEHIVMILYSETMEQFEESF